MRRVLTGVLTAVIFGFATSPAAAIDPLDINKQITDDAHVLGDQQPAVQKALDRFFDRTGDRMYVVYVPSFGDLTPGEWAAQSAKKSHLGQTGVLLVFATKDRAFGHIASDGNLTAQGLDDIDSRQIRPALRDDNYAKATINAAEAYGDLAEQGPLPWAWIVTGIGVALIALFIIVRRNRRRFEATHHVLDEHGNPVDPADILSLDAINKTSAAALVAVDDALLTSSRDVECASVQLGEAAVQPFSAVTSAGRIELDDAFRRRQKLDKLIAKGRSDDEAERKWRKRASRIIAICEQVDGALDAQTEAFDHARDLKHTAAQLLDELEPKVAQAIGRVPGAREVYAQLPTRDANSVRGNVELADDLLRAAARQLDKRRDEAPTRVRAVEDALATATALLDAVSDVDARQGNTSIAWTVATTERYVGSRRGAVGVGARTLRSEARRHFDAAQATDDPAVADAELNRAAQFAAAGLEAAQADVAAWQKGREASDDPYSRTFDALVLAGILVDETDSGGLKTLLGGASHGGGSGAPYRGTEHGTMRTAGSFGGTTTRGRRGGF